jgi:hypothetical protein
MYKCFYETTSGMDLFRPECKMAFYMQLLDKPKFLNNGNSGYQGT